MKKLYVCGFNSQYGISELEGKSGSINLSEIKTNFDASLILSYTALNSKTVIVTKDGVTLGIGDNKKYEISFSLPKQILDHFTKIELLDINNNPCQAISAVCGCDYTLYLVSSREKKGQNQLAYSSSELKIQKKFPLILNTGSLNPVSIFGGLDDCAAIDSEGGIIYIHNSIIESPTDFIEPIFLPKGEKAVSVACCRDFVIALSSKGRIFKSGSKKNLNFSEITELEGEEITFISGVCNHCFAVTKNYKVFAYGSGGSYGRLGLGKDASEVTKFTEVLSLSKYKICAAYAGTVHSLFQTIEGNVLTCGSNTCEQFIPNKSGCIYEPVELPIKNVSFCVSGNCTSSFFINYIPPMIPNKQTNFSSISSAAKSSDDISSLKAENEQLKKKLAEKDEEIEKQKLEYESEINKLKAGKGKQLTTRQNQKDKSRQIEILDIDAINNLNKLEEISYGSSGKVYKVARQIIYALKVMKVDTKAEDFRRFVQEYEMMRFLEHPNIVKTFGIFLSHATHPPSILLEFCPKNLESLIKKENPTNAELVFIIYQIVEGMKYVHFRQVIHRDLKPSNILIGSDGKVRISDFGISKLMSAEEQSMTGGVGTQKFMAPEILNEEEYNEKVDVYSFGVVLFFILSHGGMPKITIIQVGNGKKAKIPETFNEFSRQLINRCWNFESEDRPSFEQICTELEKNDYNLIDLTKSEQKEVKKLIMDHKQSIPKY